MSLKSIAAMVAVGEGHRLNVAEECRRAGVSRKTFYKWVARYRAGGLEGLEERSRRPRSNPNQTPPEVEDRIVRLRKELDEAGLDHGAVSIRSRLAVEGALMVPSTATVHRVLVRRGQVTPAPRKRPKSSFCRFEAPAPNEWWQIDATEWATAEGTVSVFNIIDDHSRVLTRSRAVPHATTEEAWVTFCEAGQVWGLPAGTLSDNGLAFSGKLRGFEVFFEAQLRDAGIRPFTGRPYHPQTTGKVERFQQTLKKWLRRQPLAAGLAELQTQLDTFAGIYNFDRPHQGISGATPAARWHATPASGPAPGPLEHPDWAPQVFHSTVDVDGRVKAGRYRIHIGVEHHHCRAVIIIDTRHANVFIDTQLVRHLKLDPTRTYQASGRPRGGPRQTRLTS